MLDTALPLQGSCAKSSAETDPCRWRAVTDRSRQIKVVIVTVAVLVAGAFLASLQIIWLTRARSVPGSYQFDQAWATATLHLGADGRFEEHWKGRSGDTNRAGGEGTIKGRWRDQGRDWLTRDISLDRFIWFSKDGSGHGPVRAKGIVTGYGDNPVIVIDADEDIVFRK